MIEDQERLAKLEQIILSRISNDRYLDMQEENQIFVRAGDEWGLAYEEALEVVERVLAEHGAVRERTAIEEFRRQLKPMLEDQYLERSELQQAYQIGEQLGLSRAEDPEFIDRLVREEQRRYSALTEDVARLRLARYQVQRARFNLISPQSLAETVEELLHEYHLEENPQTRPQIQTLARDVARANGLYVVRVPFLLIGIGVTLALAAFLGIYLLLIGQ